MGAISPMEHELHNSAVELEAEESNEKNQAWGKAGILIVVRTVVQT